MFSVISPSIFLMLVLASIYALLFHLLWGKRLRQLALFWVAAATGFFLGDLLAVASGFSILRIGQLHIDLGSVASWGAMFLVRRFIP